MWKCNECQEMVAEDMLDQHKCSLIADLKPRNLRGSKLGEQVSGALEIAYLRGKQSKDD